MMLNQARKELPKLKSDDEKASLLVLVEYSCASIYSNAGFDVPQVFDVEWTDSHVKVIDRSLSQLLLGIFCLPHITPLLARICF